MRTRHDTAWQAAFKLYPSWRYRFSVAYPDVPRTYKVVHVYDWEEGRFIASIFGERP